MEAATVVTVIRPRRGWAFPPFRELWRYRDLLGILSVRDVKLRYRQTALGAAWVVLQPILGAGVFAFLFGTVADLPTGGLPPLLFSYAGLLGWNAFATILTKCGNSLVSNTHLVSKIYFPRLLLPLSTVPPVLLDTAIALVVMITLYAVFGVAPPLAVLLLPLWLLGVVLLAVGAGLVTSALAVRFRDVQYVVPVVLGLLVFATPVGYSRDAVPENARLLFSVNPMVGYLEGFRWSLLPGMRLSTGAVAYSAVVTLVVLLAGALAFTRMERRFADVI